MATITTERTDLAQRLAAVEAELTRHRVERGLLLRTVEKLNARLALAEGSLLWLRAGDRARG